jgi:hypothetical protein
VTKRTILTLILLPGFLAGAVKSQRVSLPLDFEINNGQFTPNVLYLARTANHFIYLTRAGMTLGLSSAHESGAVLPMTLLHANPRTSITADAGAGGVSNYFFGNDPALWKRAVPHYGRVRYSGVWPGIDLVFHGKGESLEYDFVVSPGRDPAAIRMSYPSAQAMRVDAKGDLVVTTANGEVRQHRPDRSTEKSQARATASKADTASPPPTKSSLQYLLTTLPLF